MARAVLKFLLPPTFKSGPIEIPIGGVVVYAGMQRGGGHLWVECPDHDAPTVERYFQVFSTGQEIPAEAKYLKTFFEDQANYVWHLYEVPA